MHRRSGTQQVEATKASYPFTFNAYLAAFWFGQGELLRARAGAEKKMPVHNAYKALAYRAFQIWLEALKKAHSILTKRFPTQNFKPVQNMTQRERDKPSKVFTSASKYIFNCVLSR